MQDIAQIPMPARAAANMSAWDEQRITTDALRATTDEGGLYTFWDYQGGGWQRNNGIRIDHLLLSPQAADLLRDAGVDKQMRALEKASDHTPAWIELQVA